MTESLPHRALDWRQSKLCQHHAVNKGTYMEMTQHSNKLFHVKQHTQSLVRTGWIEESLGRIVLRRLCLRPIDVMIFKIFSPQKLEKKLAISTKIFCYRYTQVEKRTKTLVSQEKHANFPPKIGIITLAPG
jgi:hypothetical protein